MVSKMSVIHPSFKHGKNIRIGHFCVIEEDVKVGDNVVIGNYVLLKPFTFIGDNTFIDSYVLTSGTCRIGNNCKIRYRSVIARNVEIGNDVFFSAGVKTVNLDPMQAEAKKVMWIGDGCFIGDNAIIMDGIRIAPFTIIGAASLVTRDCNTNGVYYGVPAKFMRPVKEGELYALQNS